MEHKEVLKEREFQVVFLYSKRGGVYFCGGKYFKKRSLGGVIWYIWVSVFE